MTKVNNSTDNSMSLFDKDLNKTRPNRVLIIGKEGYGTHTVLKNLLHDIRNDIDSSLMLSSYGEEKNNEYSRMIPHLQTLSDDSEDKKINTVHLTNFVEQQKQRIRDNIFKTSSIDFSKNRCLIILNNVQNYWFQHSDIIKNLFLTSKQFNISLIVLCNPGASISPEFRTNIDYVFATKEIDMKNMKNLYERYFYAIPTFTVLQQIMSTMETFSCMVIDNTNLADDYKKIIYSWKPQPLHNIKYICINDI